MGPLIHGLFTAHQISHRCVAIIFNINFSLKKTGKVTLKIYNLQGKLVRTLVDEKKFTGTYSMLWDGTDQQGMKATAGIYIYTLRVSRFEQSKKLVFVK